MASWYRRFVPGFSSVMEPLHALTSKNCKFRWSQECESAFLTIKETLFTAPVLACPDFEKPFDLFVNGSQTGLGGILSQEGRVVAYASRSLTKAEKKYCPTEIECLAVLWSIEKFKSYLEGYSFNVITDHSSLRWIMGYLTKKLIWTKGIFFGAVCSENISAISPPQKKNTANGKK